MCPLPLHVHVPLLPPSPSLPPSLPPSTAVLKSLQECASLDPEWLREELGEQPYQQLKAAVSKLDLQLWLQEQKLGGAFPILVNEGYTSRNQLYTMDLEKVLQVE